MPDSERFELLFQALKQAQAEIDLSESESNTIEQAPIFDAIAEMQQFVNNLSDQQPVVYMTI